MKEKYNIDATTIGKIQVAGAALHDAQSALADEGQRVAERVREALGQDAFSVSNDQLFEQWKTVSRMAQALAAMETQLKDVYFAAVELGTVGGKSVPSSAAPRLALASPLARGVRSGDVVDVVMDDARNAPRKSSGRRAARGAASSTSTATPEPQLKGNTASAWAFLRTRLDRDQFTRWTHAELSSGVPLALGSVGAAIGNLIAKGLLVEGERGSYRLA